MMVSNIDPTKPTTGIATTQSVRANFGSAKNEIESLQANGIEGLTTAEVNQLKNIETTTISAGDWSVMAASTASYTTAEETKLADAAVLSSANAFTGINTNTAQPAFLAVNSTIDNNVTGNGVEFTCIFDSEVFDQGSDFNGTSTFTAPVAGRYQLSTIITLAEVTATNTDARLQIVTSNRTYRKDFNPGNLEASGAHGTVSIGLSMLTDMDASDTATVTIDVEQGTQVVDVSGTFTQFSGVLIA